MKEEFTMAKLRVGLIGVGGIMNGVHIPGYLELPERCEITAVCDIKKEALERAARRLNLPAERCFTSYIDLMDSGLVDAVDIATHDSMHCPIAAEAVKRGLSFSSEKPMGMNYHEVKAVCDEAAKKGLPGHVCFTWHYRPYVRMMRQTIRSGRLGRIFHIYIRCIKDSGLWENRPLEWRFDERYSASGVMGDLASHMFDIARFVGSEYESVSADAGIFVKERPALDGGEMRPVTTWDWCNVLARMQDGSNATFQISRTAKNIGDWIQVEVYGEKGRLVYSFFSKPVTYETTQRLEVQTDGEVEELIPTEADAANQSGAFLNLIEGTTDGLEATLEEGMRCQAVLDAAYRSVREHRWVTIDEVVKEG